MKAQAGALATIAVVGVALSLTGCGGGGKSSGANTTTSSRSQDTTGAKTTTSSRSQDTTAVSSSSAASGAAFDAWGKQAFNNSTNAGAFNSLGSAAAAVAGDYNATTQPLSLDEACSALKLRVTQDGSNAFSDSPDLAFNETMRKAMSDLGSASSHCGHDDQVAKTEVNKGMVDLQTALARIKSLGGKAP